MCDRKQGVVVVMVGRSRITRVELRRVAQVFGSTVALRGVDLAFATGALNLIVGSNGSGKTTLLRIVGTTLRPTAGTVAYLPGHDEESVRSEIGWLSHDSLSYPDLSGRENVMLAASLQGLSAAAAWRRTAERFHLGRFAERPVRTNSRGQRQRVALARALVHEPSLLLLDEPTAGLDTEGVETLLSVVRAEVSKGRLVLVVTHDRYLFSDMPVRVSALERGRVVDVE